MAVTDESWVGDVGQREWTAVVARTHIAAETSADPNVDDICATVSADAFFAAPVRTRRGQELPSGTVLVDPSQVRGYYSKRAGDYIVTASAELKIVTTDWYLFKESAASLLGTGDIGGVPAAGREFVVNSAVLFPSAADGIKGEIAVTRYPFADVVTGDVQLPDPSKDDRRHLPLGEMANGDLLDRFIQAGLATDHAALGATMSDNYSIAVRLDDVAGVADVVTATDRGAGATAVGRLFAGATDVTLLARVTTEWYVFAEYLMQLDNGGMRRLAAIQPVESGRFLGMFGYGFAEDVSGRRAG